MSSQRKHKGLNTHSESQLPRPHDILKMPLPSLFLCLSNTETIFLSNLKLPHILPPTILLGLGTSHGLAGVASTHQPCPTCP